MKEAWLQLSFYFTRSTHGPPVDDEAELLTDV
jgi:hypothetical protein